MCDLMLNLLNIIVRVLEIDLFDGHDLLRRYVYRSVHDTETAGADLFEDAVLSPRLITHIEHVW